MDKACTVQHFVDEFEEKHFFDFLNKLYQANLAKFTLGMSPAALVSAYVAWLAQLSQAPGTLLELWCYPLIQANPYLHDILCNEVSSYQKDIRFHKESWESMPWRFYAESFLVFEDWWKHATTCVPGLSSSVERTIAFSARQFLDALSPSNFIFTNPDLFQETLLTAGANVFNGMTIGLSDMLDKIAGTPPAGSENFMPGKQVAITPGKIVFKNDLIELIQYQPQTQTVFKEPILIIPAWIMKYYILDLSPHNSLVKWLVSQGHSVFMISWKNPDKKDAYLGMDDYFRQGAMAAIDTISKTLKSKIHLMGYCLGGTLAMITASYMAKMQDQRLKSLSLLAAQGDFTEAGELMLFISQSELSFLKNMMWEQGYLDTKQMAGSFQMLRSYDLIWSKMVQDYMHGTQRGMIDLLSWNADATRMPYKMHSEYLEKLFLNNDFAEGRFTVENELIAPKNIQVPIFCVSTETDHVAPWKSVYKIHMMTNADVTFVLTNGGHNAGIISDPSHKGRAYRIYDRKENEPYIGPKKWLSMASPHEGSWWPAWHTWIVEHSALKKVPAYQPRSTLPDAPGEYVLQK